MRVYEKMADLLVKNDICAEDDKNIIIYGLNSATELVFNVVTTLYIGYILGMKVESILFLVGFSFLRSYAGGYHAERGITCYILSSIIVVIALAMTSVIVKNQMWFLGVFLLVISTIIIWFIAPVPARHKPISENEKIQYKKRTRTILVLKELIIIALNIFSFYRISVVLMMGIHVVAILLLIEAIHKKILIIGGSNGTN